MRRRTYVSKLFSWHGMTLLDSGLCRTILDNTAADGLHRGAGGCRADTWNFLARISAQFRKLVATVTHAHGQGGQPVPETGIRARCNGSCEIGQ